MSGLSPIEQAFLDKAFERLKTTRRTFTEKEALQTALREGYELKLSFDSRFARAEPRQGPILPHWRLTDQTLANTRLLNELKAGTWDGRNLDEKLQELEQEDQLQYTFYPHDPRMFLNRQGAWEAAGERQITLPLGLKEELDTFIEHLQARWTKPLTVIEILTHLEELGWTHDNINSVHRCIRAWLLTTAQFRRVGQDYWLPGEQLPPEVQRTRLQVLPVRTTTADQNLPDQENPAEWFFDGENGKAQRKRVAIAFKGTATKAQVVWTTTLLSIHLIEGFIPVPKTVRGVYPPGAPGEGEITALNGLWYDDAEMIWLWLDRAHHRLYGPDLLDKIGFLPAGMKLQITWDAEQVILREAGLDEQVQREETRLIDLEELKKLRGGIGESYRQAIQALLSATPEGLTFKEIVEALRQRQQHEVTRRTIRTILHSGGFIQREGRWYAASDSSAGARQLREALLEALVGEEERREEAVISHREYISTRVKAIHSRLQEITSVLRQNVDFK